MMLLSKIVATNAKHYYTKSCNTKRQRESGQTCFSSHVFSFLCLLWFLKRQQTFNIYCAHAQWVLQVVVLQLSFFNPNHELIPYLGNHLSIQEYFPRHRWSTQHIKINNLQIIFVTTLEHVGHQPSTWIYIQTLDVKIFTSVVCHAYQRIFLSSHAHRCAPLTSVSILRYGWSSLASSEGEHRAFASKSVDQICN